jgi:polyisoprenoid-binding protein YceI
MFAVFPAFARQIGLLACIAAFLISPLPVDAAAERWQVIPDQSSVSFLVGSLLGHVSGRFDQVRGTLLVDPESNLLQAMQVQVAAASTRTGDPLYDRVVRSNLFFDADHFPWLRFEAARQTVDPWLPQTLNGVLSIRGVAAPLRLNLAGATVVDGGGLRLRAGGVVSRSTLGLTGFASALDDRISLSVDLVVCPERAARP